MAMGNYCYCQYTECPYATVSGKCQDNIWEDFGICEMYGDMMPNKDLDKELRQSIAKAIIQNKCKKNKLLNNLESLRIDVDAETMYCDPTGELRERYIRANEMLDDCISYIKEYLKENI